MDKVIIKECPKHGFSEHVLRRDGKYRCRKCVSEATSERRRKLKKRLVEYKGGKCEICGYDKCVDALEFHHINPDQKEFGISNGNYCSFERVRKEADKCIMVCSNCHKEIHNEIRMKELEENRKKEQENIEAFNRTNKRNKISLLNVDKIKEDIHSGLKQRDIANKYNISVGTLKRFLKQNEIKMM